MKPHPVEESLAQFRDTCARFVKTHVADHIHEWEEAELFPRSLFEEAAKAGILGAGFPEEWGGAGDTMYSLVAIEGLMTAGSGGLIAGLVSLGIALPPILQLGTGEQKQRLLPPVMAGKKIAALAITEPGTGSDVAGIRTRAVRDGDH